MWSGNCCEDSLLFRILPACVLFVGNAAVILEQGMGFVEPSQLVDGAMTASICNTKEAGKEAMKRLGRRQEQRQQEHGLIKKGVAHQKGGKHELALRNYCAANAEKRQCVTCSFDGAFFHFIRMQKEHKINANNQQHRT